MASINTIVKRKQYLWLGIVVVGTASAIGGALYLSDVDMSGNGETVAEQEPVPDMTGVVDTTFDDKVRQHATTEMQVTAAQMQKQYEEIRRELDVLNKQRGDDQRRIEKLGQDNAALAEQVKALGANPVTATGEPVPQMPASPPGPEGEPQPGNTPVSFPPQGSVAVPPPTAFYPGNGVTPPPQVTYQSVPVPNRIQRKVFTRNEGKQGPSLPYIPSGSFAKAMLIEGADANASVTGNESTVPMQLRITGLVEMPNSKTYDATGCFVGLEAWGDVSSERAIVRTRNISCLKDGKTIDMPIIGHAMVASYEMIFTQPDSVTYSKTGMLFGAELVSKSTDFLSRNPEIANLFQDYVQNCVMGDIYLNHKYTLEELMASADPYTLIFSRPSPLRGVYDSNNNFVTCKDASVLLKDKLNLDTQSGGKTWHYYAQQLFGGRPDPNLLFSTLIGDSYSYFYGSSKSASQIIRQNVTINALKEGITSYAARNGDSASLVNLATTSSMEKQRLAHVSIGHVAMRTLPMTQTILTGIAIGIFPLLVLAAVFNKLTLSVLKGYVFALMWLQSWPMLYAILNSAMTFYAKQNGAPVVLSEISQIQLKYSDLASTAGYLSMMIPPLSWMMVRGLGAGFSSVYSHFASSAISPTASAAGSVVDGNYSYGNMQTENVNGFSWSTNSTTSFGQMMYQTGSGATATQTRDGNMVMDASGAMSRLPVGINATRQIAAAQQEMAREASNRAESALHGFSSSIASAWNSLSQFGSNRGSSDSVTGGADSTMSAQDSMMASRMRSAVESYAKAHNISNEQATRELASRSTRGSAGMYGDAHAEWGVKPKILGVGGGVGVRGGGRASIDWSDEDAHQASSGSRASHDTRHDIDARATQDFKEASDYFTSRKVSESGSHTDNNADSRVDQLSAALNSAKQSYDQYTTNMTRSHEYAEMASRTESMSGQMSEDLSQQFAQYVMKHAPQDAEAILTNTSSPEIAERRRAMAWSFVQEQVQPGVDNAWRESRGDIGKGMESVPSGGGSQDIIADHQGHQAIIEQRTQDSNIRNDVKHQVDNMVTEYRGNIGDTQSSIRGEENIVGRQYSELQNHHKTEALSQNNKYNEEKSGQERMPGADSPQELMKRAKEYQDKHKQ
ncbi:conjugal transfer protein TraG [Escherichia coli]|nr:conjugal transfer protein TraG [Escherichia coli]